MSKKIRFLLVLLLGLSLVLVSCQTTNELAPAPATAVVEAPEPTSTPEPEPTNTPEPEPTDTPEPEPTTVPAPVAATPEELDESFQSFLADMDHYNIIGLDDANAALLEEPAPFLLDVRQPGEVEENGHIPGAVLVPIRELAANLDKLPALDEPIIVYCAGGWRATIAATALEAMGWEDVKILKDGSFAGWVEADFPVAAGLPPEGATLNAANPDLALVVTIDNMLQNLPEGWGSIKADALNTELIENPDIILIDVRTHAEVAEKGYIDGGNENIHVPVEQFVTDRDMWPAEKDTEIVVYCGSGHRSTIGMAILNSYGYENVRSLSGGFGGWAEAGFPTAGGRATLETTLATFVENMDHYGIVSLEDTNVSLLEDPPPFLLDVRTVAEVEEKGHIPGATLIPLRELAQNLEYLPGFDTPLIVYCGSGWRANIAMTSLEALGWESVKSLQGGSFGGWVAAGYPVAAGLPPENMELGVADTDPALVAEIDAMLQNLPDGWGTIKADDLNTILIENPDLVVIDVRRPDELADKGLIAAPNLVHIPLETFMTSQDQWPAQDTMLVIYCGSGHRSTIAMSILRSLGYENVSSLVGGFSAWEAADYAVTAYASP